MSGVRLFVYGTLMRGETNAAQVARARFLGPALTVAAYTLVDLGAHPGMLADGATAIAGELYDVDAGTLQTLDAFEEHPDVYLRAPIRLADGGDAIAYVLRPEHARDAAPIPGGDWRARRVSR